MKCPHCEYKNGWDDEMLTDIEGLNGEFYKLPVEMKRPYIGYGRQYECIDLFACPKCFKTFISD